MAITEQYIERREVDKQTQVRVNVTESMCEREEGLRVNRMDESAV